MRTPFGTYSSVPPRPAGRVERRKLVLERIDDVPLEERPQQVAVLGHQPCRDCRTARPAWPTSATSSPTHRAAVDAHGPAAQLDAGRQQRVRQATCRGARAVPDRAVEPIELEQPDVGPHPLFVADRWASAVRGTAARPCGACRSATPARRARPEKRRTPAGVKPVDRSGGNQAVLLDARTRRSDVNPRCLPSAARSAGSFRRRIPSAALSSAAR